MDGFNSGLGMTYYNSVLEKLGKLQSELEKIIGIYKECEASSKDTKGRKEEMEIDINNTVDTIRKELYAKLNELLDKLKEHQRGQQSESLKLQQEISMLKKDKLDLYQKINEMQKRISDMELTIGQDINDFEK